MTFPTIVARTETPTTSAGNPTINFTQTTGDMVVIFLGISDTAQDTPALPGGWDHFWDSTLKCSVIYRRSLDGSEGGSITADFASNTKGAAIAFNIQGAYSGLGAAIEVALASGSGTTPDPPSLTPSWGAADTLWIAAFRQNGEELDDDTWCNSPPTNFGNLRQVTSGTGGAASSNGSVAAADRQFNGTSLNPDTFSVDQSLAWDAFTIAIRPAGAGPVALAGSSAGVGTAAAGPLHKSIPIAGSSAGVGTAVGRVGIPRALAGSSAGVATAVAGPLHRAVPLAGSSAGVATAAAGPLAIFKGLAGSSAGVGTAVALVSVRRGLVGASAGAATADSALSTQGQTTLAGTSAGVGTATARLSGSVPLVAASAGVGTAAGFTRVAVRLGGASAGTGTAVAALSTLGQVQLAGTSAGTGTGVAFVRVGVRLSASSAGVGTAAGAAKVNRGLVGAAAGTGVASASLRRQLQVAGSSAGAGAADGHLTVGAAGQLVGAASGSSVAAARLAVAIMLRGSAAGTAAGSSATMARRGYFHLANGDRVTFVSPE